MCTAPHAEATACLSYRVTATVTRKGEGVDLLSCPELGRLLDGASDRVVRAAGTRDALVAGAVHQSGDDMIKDDPVRDARVVAAERVRVDVLGQQRRELVPQRLERA